MAFAKKKAMAEHKENGKWMLLQEERRVLVASRKQYIT